MVLPLQIAPLQLNGAMVMVHYCTYEQVGGDEDSTGAGPELLHDQISVLLIHVAMLKRKKKSELEQTPRPKMFRGESSERYHSRNGEVFCLHLLSEPVDLPLGVDENDGLRDGQGLVEVRQSIQLPFLLVLQPIFIHLS